MLDRDGRVATWNVGAERIKGYAASEIIGQHFSTFYPPESVASGAPQRALDVAARVGRFEDEGLRVRKDGTRFWASCVLTALRDSHGELRGFGKVTRDLTLRRAADDALRHAEQRFHHLVDAVVDYAIYLLDDSGHVTSWNSGARRLKGYRDEEVLGQHFSIFYTAEDRAADKPRRVLETVRREGRYEEEGWRVRKDGSRFWANVVITALRDQQGAVTGFAKVTRDLTARRDAEEKHRSLIREQTAREVAEQSEQRLLESEERYRALSQRLEIILEGVADGITVQDAEGRLVFANRSAARMFGFGGRRELLDTPRAALAARFDVRDAEGRALALDELPARRVLAGEEASATTLHVRERATRREWWVLLRASAVLDASGAPELAISIWHDVTIERRHEQETLTLMRATTAIASSLVASDMLPALGRALLPNLGDWCSIYLREGKELRVVTVNHTDAEKVDAAREYRRRYPPDVTHTGGVWQVMDTGRSLVDNQVDEASLARSIADTEARRLLLSIGMKAVVLAPIRANERVLGVIALVSAATDRRYDDSDVALVEEIGRRAGVALDNAQLYSAAQQAANRAEEASRAKDEFLATVSHELRTPLNAILGWSSLLKERFAEGGLVKPIEVIHRNAQAQVKIVDDILDVSRVINGKFRLSLRPSDVVAIVRSGIEVVRPSAEAKQIAINFQPPEQLDPLLADPERLQQVVWNLLSNAVKFSDPGAKVDVSLRQDGAQLQLTVADTGRGIEPGFLPFVFDRFKQADSSTTRRVGGLGLGLALVRHIVELHGGRVAASSSGVGQGAAFTVTLPLRPARPHGAAATVVANASPSVDANGNAALHGARVLVIDDEPDARELLAAVLTEAGADVRLASSAAEGFELFKRFQPSVLVSDIGMPEEDGLSLMRRIRALPASEGSRVPSLALTAFAADADRRRALAAGFSAHIGKPVNPEALVATLAQLSTS